MRAIIQSFGILRNHNIYELVTKSINCQRDIDLNIFSHTDLTIKKILLKTKKNREMDQIFTYKKKSY
jgi:hypothetical protein